FSVPGETKRVIGAAAQIPDRVIFKGRQLFRGLGDISRLLVDILSSITFAQIKNTGTVVGKNGFAVFSVKRAYLLIHLLFNVHDPDISGDCRGRMFTLVTLIPLNIFKDNLLAFIVKMRRGHASSTDK